MVRSWLVHDVQTVATEETGVEDGAGRAVRAARRRRRARAALPPRQRAAHRTLTRHYATHPPLN